MKIGILGVGRIGRTLVLTLSAAGHDVRAANSRGPETIDPDVFANGGRAATREEAVAGVDVVILSMPLRGVPAVAPLIRSLPEEAVVIDTSNYFPHRDGRIDAIEAGQVESLWVSEQLGRPIAKAWNAIGSASFARKGKPAGHPDRIALPVAADRETDRDVALALVNDTGFDGYDAGPLAESWRQQPGAPAYCTCLTSHELGAALAAAEASRLPVRRDLAVQAIMERMGGDTTANLDADYLVRLHRALYL